MYKSLKLFSNNLSSTVQIDFDKQEVIFENRIAKIDKVVNNVIYIDNELKKKEAIVFDDNYAISGIIDEPNLFHFQPMSIWLMPKSKALFFEVAKNACTSVLSSIYLSNWKKWYTPNLSLNKSRAIWNLLGWNNDYFRKRMLVPNKKYVQNQILYSDYIKFLVYNDPLDRFLSMANNKYIEHPTSASAIKPPYDSNIHDFIDKLLLVVQLDCLNTIAWDQHLAPITLNGACYLDDITHFVYLEDLDVFMKDMFDITVPHHNVMPKDKKCISKETLLPRQLEKIQEIYKRDYDIPLLYKDKFYIANK